MSASPRNGPAMSEPTDYFANHQHKLRFPWSLYHRPIVQALEASLGASTGPDVLNVGSGPFLELSQIDSRERRITICDIDARSIEKARELHGKRLVGADVVAPDAPLPYPDDRFDLVVSMDVVEHLPDPAPWLAEVLRVVRPGGTVFLTTPNYASRSLVVIENTALELIARAQGFSRGDLHPSKMTPDRLRKLLVDAGAERIDIQPLSFGWVLGARASKPRPKTPRE
jgi:SAM-dependent methyltransferase